MAMACREGDTDFEARSRSLPYRCLRRSGGVNIGTTLGVYGD